MKDSIALAWGSVIVSVAVLALKTGAWAMTGSVALLADALESTVNVVAAGAALLAVRYSAIPADDNHPYGHAKAEYFSAVLEGVFIVVAAGMILWQSYWAFQDPRLPEAPWSGLGVSLVATAVNAAWAAVLLRRGRALRSPALIADARHLWSDVVTSGGVVVGVGLAAVTGFALLDPTLAALTALNILFSGWRLLRESVGGLMDEAVPPETLAQVRATVSAAAEGAIEAHDLRTRRAGRQTFVEFHLVVPGEMPVATAHDICDRVEVALRDLLGPATITIHVEPEGKAKHSGVLVL